MIFEVGGILVNMELLKEYFMCDLSKCKGACCVEGDAGPPVTQEEVEEIRMIHDLVQKDISEKARKVILEQGLSYRDAEGDLVLSIVDGKDCVYTCYGQDGCCYCALDGAFRKGLTRFRKPASCYLYPIRVDQVGPYKALNLHRWDICKDAFLEGKRQKVHVYEFLREPLIEAFGKEWYDELLVLVRELRQQHYLK